MTFNVQANTFKHSNDGHCERKTPYVCEVCILSANLADDPNDKYRCDGCSISTEFGKAECKQCINNTLPADPSSTLPAEPSSTLPALPSSTLPATGVEGSNGNNMELTTKSTIDPQKGGMNKAFIKELLFS